jgi:hypothetical protein
MLGHHEQASFTLEVTQALCGGIFCISLGHIFGYRAVAYKNVFLGIGKEVFTTEAYP